MEAKNVPFPSVVGHETIRRHLMGACLSDSVSHAYIFEGNPGVGRHTMAFALAQTLVCTENKDADGHIVGSGCGNCIACRTCVDGNHPDVRLISRPLDKEKKQKRKQLPVDTVRDELVKDVAVRPYYGGRKCYIIEDAETMNAAAQNALLKTLEEPPEYAVIILISTSAAALLSTVESRSVKISFQPLPEGLIRSEMEKRGFTPEQVALGATFAGGSLGQALAACSNESFADMRRDVYAMLADVPGKSAGWLLAQTPSLETYKENARKALSLMEAWFRDVLVLNQVGQGARLLSEDYRDAIAKAADFYSPEQLSRIIWQISDTYEKLEQNANFSLAMDNLMLSMEKRETAK